MRGKHTLVINGKVYDAVTGLPVAAPDPVPLAPKPVSQAPQSQDIITPVTKRPQARPAHHAANTHATTQKSATLRRDVLKKPTTKPQVGALRRKPAIGHVAKSDQIHRFAPHPHPISPPATKPPRGTSQDIVAAKVAPAAIVAQKHALVQTKPVAQQARQVLSTKSVKEHLISERMAQVDLSATTPARNVKPKKRLLSSGPRIASFMTVSLAIMLLGGYFTYLNMPGLSVRVAAAQADVAATFPDYHPDGYRFNGPVAYAPGQVAINFNANGGTSKYTVTEQKSGWDSQAVYDNIIAKTADNSYVTNSQQGLTIYTFAGKAAWVNKGILYTVNGDAPLNNEQLLRIAASL